jgi:hypothetical protein
MGQLLASITRDGIVHTRWSNEAVSVGTSSTTLLTLDLSGLAGLVTVHLSNTGATALSAVTVSVKGHRSGAAYVSYLASSDLSTGTAIDGKLVQVSTDPTTLAGGSDSVFTIDASGVDQMIIAATVGSGTTTVDAFALVSP